MPLPFRHVLRLTPVLLALALAAPLPAQVTPPSNAAKNVEADVKFALREAFRLTATDPPKAADRLQKLQTQLESDRVLSPDRRAQLTRVVKDQLRVAQAGPMTPTDDKPLPLSPEAATKAEEFARVKADLEAAVALRKAGKGAEAGQKLAELSKQFPDNVAVQVLTGINQVSERRDEAKAIQQDKDRGISSTLNNVDRTAVMPRGDIEFPKDWKEKTAQRKADTAPTAAELKVLQALNSPVNARFNNSRIEDALDSLSTVMGLTIILDKASLDDLQITYDTPVTFAVRQPVAARTALRAILRGLGLTFVVREGTVFVTTPARAQEFLVTKAYYLGDLIKPIGNPFAPVGDPLLEALNVASLIQMIVTSIDPESWDVRGGPGSVRYYAPKMGIIVKQSAEVHTMIRGGLYR